MSFNPNDHMRTVQGGQPPGQRRYLNTGVRRYTLDESFFSQIDTPEKAYWLGFVATDGGIRPPHYIRVDLHSKDEAHLWQMARDMGYSGPVQVYHRASGQSYASLTICSRQLVDQLAALGMTPGKQTRTSPVWTGSETQPELIRDYWRGLFDADGGINKAESKRKTKENYICYNINLGGVKPVVDAFSDYCFPIAGSHGTVIPHRSIWLYSLGGRFLTAKLMRHLYQDGDVCLERKRARADAVLALVA